MDKRISFVNVKIDEQALADAIKQAKESNWQPVIIPFDEKTVTLPADSLGGYLHDIDAEPETDWYMQEREWEDDEIRNEMSSK